MYFNLLKIIFEVQVPFKSSKLIESVLVGLTNYQTMILNLIIEID